MAALLPRKAVQVAASLIGPTLASSTEVRKRKSAIPPPGLGNVVSSMMRNLSRVTFPPVLLTTRLRTFSVPNVDWFPGSLVKSRTRFGGDDDDTVPSSIFTAMVFRRSGDARFSGARRAEVLRNSGDECPLRIRQTGSQPSCRSCPSGVPGVEQPTFCT
jgi:hypothetical protein